METLLQEMKRFWQLGGVWAEQESRQVYGPAVQQPDEHIWLDHTGDPIPDRYGLEWSYEDEYNGLGTVAFECDSYRKFVEGQDGLMQ